MRYFFNVRYHDVGFEDHEGVELDGLETVRREVIEAARDIIADRFRSGKPLLLDTAFEVMNEDGGPALSLSFGEVLFQALGRPLQIPPILRDIYTHKAPRHTQ